MGNVGGPSIEKLLVCFGSGLAEKNCQCGLVCALRVKKEASFSLEEKDNIYLTWILAWRRD